MTLKLIGALGVAAVSLLAQSGALLAADDFPVTVKNCGHEVTLARAPERIFIINNDDIALLDTLDALDLVVARTATPLPDIYRPEIYQALEAIPLVSGETNATGGSVISLETVLATQPDLVLGPENAVDRTILQEAGIALYSPPAYCADPSAGPQGPASFERVYEQIATFGTMLGASELAARKIADFRAMFDKAAMDEAEDAGSAVAIYVSQGGKVLSPYGAYSMVTPIFSAAGLANVYAETPERVFDVNVEDLLAKDPQTIVLLYSNGTPEAQIENFKAVPSVAGLSAVKNDRVIALPFFFTDPPTPLSLQGATMLAKKLAHLP